MTHLNETVYATGIASSYQGYATKSGAYICDEMLANVCKHHVTKMPYEIGRLAQDLAGGLVATLPSEKDLNHPEIGILLKKYLRGKADVKTEDRMRILRLSGYKLDALCNWNIKSVWLKFSPVLKRQKIKIW